jgi:S1-C subfamily serine protease
VYVVGISRGALANGLGFNVNATPIARTTSGVADGVELATIPKGSLLETAGFRQGDVVVSVNGYPAADPVWIDRVRADAGGATVVELFRNKQRVVLILEWLPEKSP